MTLNDILLQRIMTQSDFQHYAQRFQHGEWRTPLFHEMVVGDIQAKSNEQSLTILDIGCGNGFDTSKEAQRSLAALAQRYIGVEPDMKIVLEDFFSETHRCLFEEAEIPENSIDIAFACMVLEHLSTPQRFWDKVYDVLKPGGVFWGFTMHGRHYFMAASTLLEKLHLKDVYLGLLHGERGRDRYENYPTFYRSNSAQQVSRLCAAFSQCNVYSFGRVGQMDYYYPRPLQWIGRSIDRLTLAGGGGQLIVCCACCEMTDVATYHNTYTSR
jgi:SAM-dependent methyltransferase